MPEKRLLITNITYWRLRKEYEGAKGAQARRLNEQADNRQLKRLVVELALEKAITEGPRRGKLLSGDGRRRFKLLSATASQSALPPAS
jgi:hypothetical protein